MLCKILLYKVCMRPNKDRMFKHVLEKIRWTLHDTNFDIKRQASPEATSSHSGNAHRRAVHVPRGTTDPMVTVRSGLLCHSIWLRTNITHAGISICWIPKVEAIVLVPLSIGTCRRSDMVGVDRTPVSLLSPMKQKNYIAVGKDGRKQKW